MLPQDKTPQEVTAKDIENLREIFGRDKNAFTESVEKLLLRVRKKEDIGAALDLLGGLKKELGEVAPFLASSINPVMTLMIKNHYYKQIAEFADLFETCANITVFHLLEDLIGQKNSIRFLSSFEIYRIKKMVLFLSKKFQKDDVAYRLEIELEKEDLNWRDSVD